MQIALGLRVSFSNPYSAWQPGTKPDLVCSQVMEARKLENIATTPWLKAGFIGTSGLRVAHHAEQAFRLVRWPRRAVQRIGVAQARAIAELQAPHLGVRCEQNQ
jgi:hypothetical protein